MKTDVGITSVLRRFCVGALAVGALVACTPMPVESFRDLDANIGATTRFDPVRFSGDWHVVARFVETGESPERDAATISFDPDRAEMVIASKAGAETFRYTGTAVLRPSRGEPLVVMWVDEGFRTAVLGTPTGEIGFVMDRNPIPSPDRYTAATEILTFYGWDISRLQRTK